MKLYLCQHTKAENGDGDLFVRAETPAQAAEVWRTYWVGLGLSSFTHDRPDQILEIPTEGPPTPRALPWRELKSVDW